MDRDVKTLKEAVQHDIGIIIKQISKQDKDIEQLKNENRNLKLALECLIKEAEQEDIDTYIR